jgi:hypothetical protein
VVCGKRLPKIASVSLRAASYVRLRASRALKPPPSLPKWNYAPRKSVNSGKLWPLSWYTQVMDVQVFASPIKKESSNSEHGYEPIRLTKPKHRRLTGSLVCKELEMKAEFLLTYRTGTSRNYPEVRVIHELRSLSWQLDELMQHEAGESFPETANNSTPGTRRMFSAAYLKVKSCQGQGV